MAVEPARARPGRCARWRGRAPCLGRVRVPLPVPGRRREHRQRLGDVEHERRRSCRTTSPTPSPTGSPRSSRTTSSSSRTRRSAPTRRPRDLSQPRQHRDDGRLLRRPAPVLHQGRREHARRPPCRTRPVGLHRAGRVADDDATSVPASVAQLRRRRPWPACRTPPPGSPRRSSAFATRSRPTSSSPTTSPCGARTSTSATRTSPTPMSTSWPPGRRRSTRRSAPRSTSRSPTSAIATPSSSGRTTATTAPHGGTTRTSCATPGSSAGSWPRPASGWSCGRSRSATRRCAR